MKCEVCKTNDAHGKIECCDCGKSLCGSCFENGAALFNYVCKPCGAAIPNTEKPVDVSRPGEAVAQ